MPTALGQSGSANGQLHYDFVDGIRAIAVTLVVFFHFDLLGLTGGFLGVDMFFVISGFLVSDLILRNITEKNFSLIRFFERRIYRILPALYVSLILVLLVGYFILLPVDFAQTAVSARASALLFANIHFHSVIEYFNQGSQFWLLLHHWSLSVEEQFYLIFPFVLVVLSALKVRLSGVLPVLLLLTFLYSMSLSTSAPSAAFYFVQARFWEFLVGAQIAILPRAGKLPRWFAETVSSLAVAAILFSSARVAAASDLFGLATAIPVIATGLIIWSNINTSSTLIAKILSISWVRKLGLISYSLYIFHWPFIIFAQYWSIEPLSLAWRLVVLFFTVAASWLSWRFVEQPFRKIATMNARIRRMGITGVAATTFLIVCMTTWIIDNKGFVQTQAANVTASLAAADAISPERARCHSHEMVKAIPVGAACIIGSKVSATIAVWGDSHGVELAKALGDEAANQQRSVMQLTSSSCPPVLNFEAANNPGCRTKNDQVFNFLKHNSRIKYVVLAMSNSYKTDLNEFELEETIAALRRIKKKVILVAPFPRPPVNVPHARARTYYYHREQSIGSIPLSTHRRATKDFRTKVAMIPKGADFVIVDPATDFCKKDKCNFSDGHNLLYFDDNHPSIYGASLVARRISENLALANSK
jgi:peptidoglycan/LPS O-acetylase OafA/YrhL